MFKHCLNMLSTTETRNAVSWGNGAGILLPKEWVGKQVIVTLIDRSEEIKKETIDILSDKLTQISGIYLTGSYARSEQSKDSDIDILAISDNLREEISSGKYKISIIQLDKIKEAIGKNSISILPRILEAQPILNSNLLNDLKKEIKKINKEDFKEYIQETSRIIKINKSLLDLEKTENKKEISNEIIYSIMLRLRGIFIISMMLKNKNYLNKEFEKWLLMNTKLTKEKIIKIIKIYKSIRDNEKSGLKIDCLDAQEILDFLEKEVDKW